MRIISKTSLSGLFFGLLLTWCDLHPQVDRGASQKSLAAQCAPELDRMTERIFANPGGKMWKEYATVKQVPRLGAGDSELMIAVKTSPSGRRFARIVEYGEDVARFEGNCYFEDGKLHFLHYEMRTAWGWGYEDVQMFNRRGKLLSRSNRFFDTKNNQRIERPPQADDVPDFTKPIIYNTFDSLPIAGVLEKKVHATPQ